MSVSMRSTKAALYSEIERLRELCNWQEQQLSAQRDELAQLRAQLRAQRAQHEEAPRPSPRVRNELMRRLAIICKASVRWVDGQGFRQYVHGEWRPVPSHLIDYASEATP